ncbi:MAG: LysR family transcriptional regulator [Archaeoglobaceae archaeon]|nr:LysR family transcriptional regulator [Archaeoglobaceae archaeon]MDW8128119.1 substrate-binding domain-containing protein [Archaeoglobaceae archaeon]
MDAITIRYDAVIEYEGEKIVDSKVASILKALRENRSLISTSKALGMPYARLWNLISKLERLTGRKIVETKKGGKERGKAELTEFGKKLLEIYEDSISKLEEAGLIGRMQKISEKTDLVIAHSHDHVFSAILEKLSEEFNVKSLCIGSGMALAMLSLREVDVACIHLYDPKNGYNSSFLERFWLKNEVEKIGAFERELVIAYRRDLNFESLEELIAEILKGNLKIANRNRGSGSRIFFEQLLFEYSRRLKIGLENVQGYESEFYTHDEVAKQIYSSNFDAGVLLGSSARKFNLKFFHLTWEPYECYALKNRKKSAIERLKELMNSEWLKSLINVTPGYRIGSLA